jgi:3-phytase
MKTAISGCRSLAMLRRCLASLALIACCNAAAQNAQTSAPPTVAPALSTEATASGKADSAILVGGDAPAIIGTAALAGLEAYATDGRRLRATPSGEAAAVAIAPASSNDAAQGRVVAVADATGNHLRLFRLRGATLEEAGARAIDLGFAVEGVCLSRNALDGALHAFVVGDGGEIEQLLVYADAAGKLDARSVRRISVPSTLKQCAADDDGHVYAVEEATGLWRFEANPESDLSARIVDARGLGHFNGDTKGVAFLDAGAQGQWLFASDTDAGTVNAYDHANGDAFAGTFRVGTGEGDGTVAEPGTLSADTAWGVLGAALVVTDEDGPAYRVLRFADIAAALGLRAAARETGHPHAPQRPVAIVRPTVETEPVLGVGDAADDPAIWADPANPARSLVLGTDKKGGMNLYDMQGRLLQYRPDGKLNNVDLRDGFLLDGKPVVLATASNRTDQTISIYRLDTKRRELVDVADGPQPTGFADPYGLCMYHDAADGATYVFVNGDDTGMRQWRLDARGNGKVGAVAVRDFSFDSQTEGCVADDASAALFVDEEDVALWRMGARPGDGAAKTAVDRVEANPAVKADLEGLGIYDLGNGRGYIVVSSQGNDTYAVYRLEGDHAYLGSFAVVANPALGIDGISETDGLEVTSRNLGPGFEHGAMIAQDGRNVMPAANQNYKYVPWTAIAEALGLELRR